MGRFTVLEQSTKVQCPLAFFILGKTVFGRFSATNFDESLARRWLKEIVVWDDRFSVELKSGVVVEIMV